MRCSTCRSRFSEGLDARLGAGDAAAFDAHLAACAACATEFATYRRVFDAVRSSGDVRLAPAFRRPAELPAARAFAATGAASGAAPSPFRFVRVAAAVLLAAGLGLTHGMVFRYGRDVASGDQDRGFIDRTPAAPLLANALTFSRLRDHVEATDLFLRTASQMPSNAGARGRELLQADFDRLDLGRFADDLRSTDVMRDETHGTEFRTYLGSVSALCDRLESAFADGGGDLESVRDIVLKSPVTKDVAALRPIVSPVGCGRSFENRQLKGVRLAKDEKALFESRDARLSGDFARAVGGFKRFGAELRGSTFAPLADYLLAEAYARSGNYTPAIPILARLEQNGATFLPNDNLAALIVVIDPDRVFDRRVVRVQSPGPGMVIRLEATGVAGPSHFVPDMYAWPAPQNVIAYLKARDLEIRCTRDAMRRPGFSIVREDGTTLLPDLFPRLYANVKWLVGRPDVDGSILEPTEVDDRPIPQPTEAPIVR